MKNLLLFGLVIFCVSTGSVWAQSSLSFLGVALVANADTVPAGECWKVESILYSSTPVSVEGGQSGFVNITDLIIVNGNTTVVRKSTATSYVTNGISKDSNLWEITLPIWLPSGTVIAPHTGVKYLSVLRFACP